ncbi:hypothetical protein [Streptomyces sp. NPDC001978]|uniref:hypothetical protein n=1 Tax=Streptomyces sp. NPDC001978 TaxID=3364627 RepID=UPI00367D27D1
MDQVVDPAEAFVDGQRRDEEFGTDPRFGCRLCHLCCVSTFQAAFERSKRVGQ